MRPGGRFVAITPIVPARGMLRPLAVAAGVIARRGHGRISGLRTLDPRPTIERAGFELVRARSTRRGYPSLCVLAHRTQCL